MLCNYKGIKEAPSTNSACIEGSRWNLNTVILKPFNVFQLLKKRLSMGFSNKLQTFRKFCNNF